jgi:hypothetical protein
MLNVGSKVFHLPTNKFGIIIQFNNDRCVIKFEDAGEIEDSINVLIWGIEIDELKKYSHLLITCFGLGDTLVLSAAAKVLKQRGYFVELSIFTYEELFLYNKNVDKINKVFRGGLWHPVNILARVLRVDYQIKPEIYLSSEEEDFGKKEIEKIRDNRKLVAFVPHWGFIPCQYEWNSIIFDKDLQKELQFIYFGQESYKGIINFNKLTIRQVASLIKNCDIYMGINTGLYHVAKCFGLKGFVVNRLESTIKEWGYNDDKHFLLEIDDSKVFLNEFKKNWKNFLKC